ncbi:MAG: DUF72 domain-containing protein [Pirellula sp.]|nr:DUF72 domain-containing protein [Pirellula sp.]
MAEDRPFADACRVRIGTAGWSIPRDATELFPVGDSHLHRYAQSLNAVEINTSFYRPHQTKTYARWAATVPESFRFAVKLPRTITHESRLAPDSDILTSFLAEVSGLSSRLGCLLVQLPPSLRFEARVAESFFMNLRRHVDTPVVCEPRHKSWFGEEAGELLKALKVGRVVADPLADPRGATPDGDRSLIYVRLHGSPRMYYSKYDTPQLKAWYERLLAFCEQGSSVWCIFDNTAEHAAIANALELQSYTRSELT